ncbi:MAG: hypothetical protein AAFY88_03440 [Acidobacteriota bacterium]
MRRGLPAAVCGVWLAATLLAGALVAHPFDADFYSSRAIVKTVDGDVSVVVAVEVPTRRILEQFLELYGDPSQIDESSDALFRQRQFERLSRELRLRVGGRRAAGEWRPVPGEANGRGTDTFFVYLLEFVPKDPATLRAERLDLRVDMEVFPREFIYLSATVEVGLPWRLVSNSAEPILAAADDELFDPETGRWSVDPRLRRVRLVLERGGEAP